MRRVGAVAPEPGWRTWLSCLLLLMLPTLQAQLKPANTQGNFRFTRSAYNATLAENAVGKIYVKSPVRMGILLPEKSSLEVEFSIVEGDRSGIFHAETVKVEDFVFLRVRTRTGAYGRLNRERQEWYLLRIRARGSLVPDSYLETFTDLNVTLLDQNEFSPLFPPRPFSVTIPEDTPLHSSIAQVSASDAEVGINGEIYYSLVDPTPMFAIHPTSGVVSLMRPLETGAKNYKLRLRAEDRGLKPVGRPVSPLSSTTLIVTVVPTNRHAPQIHIQKFPSVLEDANPGSVFAVLTVTDRDEVVNDQIANVSILNNADFRIVPTTRPKVFNVVMSSRLDRESTPVGFNVTIKATDQGEPAKSTTVTIPVDIQDINDNPPMFEKTLYGADLLEVVPVHTPVMRVKASDADEGQNGEVRYRLKYDDASDQFSIDEVTGWISTATRLDAETEKQIVLVVYAEDRASSGTRLTGQTKVVVNVQDFNDNAPTFDKNNLDNIFINENMPSGTSVITVTATDADSGDNGRVSYSIQNTDEVPFEIDSFTGEIKTTQVFDYETTRKQFFLLVRASDWGSPYKHWTQERVIIKVQDMNDNSPEFEKTHCRGYLSREAAIGTEVVILTAIDFDAGNIISYRISEGNEDGCFSIEPSTGSVKVACDLTAYSVDSRTFTVQASDGEHLSVPSSVTLQLVNSKPSKLSATAQVSVTCQDTDVLRRLQEQLTLSSQSNQELTVISDPSQTSISVGEHGPEFDSSLPDYITVSEGAAVGSVIFKVLASDQDDGYPSQTLLVISEGNQAGTFRIDTFTGNLQITAPLDHETTQQYNLTITAQDLANPDKSAIKIFQVFISDENDNAPEFEHNVYEKEIFEDVQVNATILQVYASDKDTSVNAQVLYSLLSNADDFYIEADSGILKVRKQLDRETQPVYNILVQAEDSGLHRKLSSTTSIIIRLLDVNDNFPEFTPRLQTVRVREDLPVGAVVTTLTAHDLDDGLNGKVTYKLVDGANNKFHVDPLTGTVRIRDRLDFETTQVYNLSVRASDGGVQPLVSMCLLNVEVVDVNENHHAPEFEHFYERGSVAENSPVGTYVMSVRAFDKDEAGSNGGRITYSIRDGTGLGRFSIDVNGTIRTRQVLDRETSSHFWLSVDAQDGGLVPLQSRLEVLVEVEDVNDNVPQSLDAAYYASVPENSRRPQPVVQVLAQDGDLNPHQVLTFSITGGNPRGLFTIQPLTGLISTTSRPLDREKQEEHALEVTISDNGTPSLSSSTRVVVKVVDVNDQRPKFLDKVSRVALTLLASPPAAQGQDVFVYRAVAYDSDEGPNGEVTYNLRSSQRTQFYINRRSGHIYSRKPLAAGDVFDITVRATDNGTERRRSQQKLRITVTARPTTPSPSPPRFQEHGVQERITESDKPGTFIAILSASDPRPGHSHFFSINEGNEDSVFSIQPNHGIILLASPVDWETRDSYNLTVSVSDGLSTDTTWVYIEILDVNDNEPIFSHQRYHANVSEESDVGDHIVRVMASDRDKDDRLLYSIASASSVTSLHKFKIGPRNGVVEVREKLDREEMPRHLLTIMVRDQGVPSKKSFARVEIRVQDHNDHAPTFLSRTFEGRVFETAAVGSAVVQVIATDPDKGSNSELAYSILSGNADNMFSMDERQGNILLAKELHRSVQPVFHLVVMATDHGAPPRSSTAEVKISVTVSNNAAPVFARNEMVTELKENQPAGTVLGSVSAASQSTIIYTIIDGNHEDNFFINPNSGVITTMAIIDFEQRHFYNLTIQATNIVGAFAFSHMLIHVSDENDNNPVFTRPIFFGKVSEAAEPGTLVLSEDITPLVIEASDADSGENALLEFKIAEAEARKYFSIDASTGAIRTAASLDHEIRSQFNFTVEVQDRGQPSHSALIPAHVVISVEDVNDTPPRFSNHTYTAKVLLPTYHDVTVLKVMASDPDTVNPMNLTYSLVKGNEGEAFSIDPQSGVLRVQQTHDLLTRYDLTVQASDGRFDTLAQVVIVVEESKDTGLRFTKDLYTAHVRENMADMLNLVVVQPINSDPSRHFTFSLLNNQAVFSVGPTSGVLQTKGVPLDREQQDNYTVVVQVVCSSPEVHEAHVIVVVTVDDENDNAPMFVKQPFQTLISIDAEHGDIIKKVTATDSDMGENGEIRYYLPVHMNDNGKDAFAINQYTGDLVVKRLTDSDRNANFLLTVEAVDRGNPPRSATVDVPIRIVDSTAPVFESQHMIVQIPEDLPIHSPVKNIQATSPKNHKLIYSISAGDKYDDFAVDFNTGLVSVASELDRESQDQYELTLTATDVLTASYSSMVLTVLLQDVNDNKPVFEKLRYTQSVSEMARIGSSLLQLSARDADQGANSVIHYSLQPISEGSSDTQPFFVNSETGVVMLHRPLDHELQTEYTLLAVATDSGSPALTSTTTLHILVLDLNDNPPHFPQPSFHCSLSDQARRGQLVTKVMANDRDVSSRGQLAFAILDGNEKQAFHIDPVSGVISVSEYRTPEFSPAYVLNVSVSDGVYTSFARVTIEVRNTNRNVPRFVEQDYRAQISEMSSVGTSVVSVSAVDADRGNYGMLTYALTGQTLGEFFSIDADTGEITTRQILDREKEDHYELTVAATDNGGHMGFTKVTVTLSDQNDNMPQFLMEEYVANVFFNASIDTTITQVKAVDVDLGVNGQVQYMLHSGEDTEVGQLFAVDLNSGHITVKSSLAFAENKLYQFFVGARDQGEPALENHVPVEILVMGPDDQPPVFPTSHRSFFIQENEQVGSVIATVKAKSKEPLTYTIVPGMTPSSNNPVAFSVDQFGQIRIVRALDREVTPVYTLALQAQTLTSPPLLDTMTISIILHDVNDNPPQFESSPYLATVVENSDIGTRVIQVKAVDKDLPKSLEYSFGAGMEQMANIFSIDPSTGWVSLLSALDRETKDEYNLTVIATDRDDDTRIKGRGVRLTATTTIIITVTDYNDNAPQFDKSQFSTAVNEGALPGTVILSVIATDKDKGDNADMTYYIVSGDPLNQFEVRSSGEVFVNKGLDRESQERYQLTVGVTDGGFVSYADVMVTVLDDNDNAPQCLEPYIQVIENEDVAVGKPLAHIRASDKDEASTLNARIHYTLQGDGADKFMLEKDSGVLRTAIALDRETQQQYLLTAIATDGGGLSCMTEVQIFLRDINDNPPEFTGNFEDPLTVQEDAHVNTLLTRITTSDKDTGINRNTRYSLVDMQPTVFSINPKSGILSLVGSLDREVHPDYHLTIIAYNEVSPEMSSTAVLKVVVLDVNDNPPVFERTSYTAVVIETAAMDTVVARVTATSLDIGHNADITYSIAAGNQQGKFALGAQDGVLRVAEPLDHEVSREYFLTILARDHGSPPLSNTAIISINITDVNDNPPSFSQDRYTASVSELAQSGTEVFKVIAIDADSYANSVITYSIIFGNTAGSFIIGPQDGIIQLANPIDREQTEKFSLTIQARDSGSPMLHSTAIVDVIVEDANDNPPLFHSNNYTAKVQEGRRTGIEILTFEVSDLDAPDNGAPFTFDIVGGNDDGEFHVDTRGVLSTAGKLSKQVKEQYQLTVRVFDNGSPPLYSDAQVTIHVVDDSIYPPELANLSIQISSCMDNFPGGVIGQMEARDRDPYDTLSFDIVSMNRHLFDVHRDDGRLIALTGLDEGDYVVNVSVTDQKFTRYAQVLVTVVCISKEVMDNAVTIQLANLVPEQFYASYKHDFQQLFKRKLNVRLSDVQIINVQPSSHSSQDHNRVRRSAFDNINHVISDDSRKHRSTSYDNVLSPSVTYMDRMRRSTSDHNLDVLFAVQKAPHRYFNQKSLKRKVQKFADDIVIELGVRVVRVFSDTCEETTCSAGQCVGSVVFDESNLVPVVVNGESFVSARHFYTHKCVCLDADQCQSLQCGSKVCETYEVCGRDLYGDPYCHCPEGHTGSLCQTILSPCYGSQCDEDKAMTFSGHSFAKWTLGQPTQKRMSLWLRFRTRQSSAVLMYAKGQVDYSILAVEEGSLVYRFNCGSGEGQVWVPVDLSDGQWHSVSVERTGRVAEIMLDHSYTAMGTAPGVHDILNLDSEVVYFGAKVDVLRNGYRDISKGFEGCMEDIRMFNVPLPFEGSNSIAHSQQFEHINFNCQDSKIKVFPSTTVGRGTSVCSSAPCLNGGVCQVTGPGTYTCVCRGRYQGTWCELDSDPCQEAPCLNGGQCQVDKESPNTYMCHCPNDLLGMRCTYGANCRPNPCLYGATCIEGPTSALCHCAPGFAGLYCDKTIDACDSAPCLNGGLCVGATGGKFLCNCSTSYSGAHCENINLSHITSTSSGISAEEIYGIIGVVAGIFLLVLVFVVWRVVKRRKRGRRHGSMHGSNDTVLNGLMKDSSFDLKRKVSNPDLSVPIRNIPSQPPPVPNRPASYTPSTHDSLNMLNNLDTVRNYGSAADELETTGLRYHIPDFPEYLAALNSGPGGPRSRPSNSSSNPPSLPPLPSTTSSDTESVHKAPWEFEYPNILGSYDDDKHRDNLAKHMPGLHSPVLNSRPLMGQGEHTQNDSASLSSLPLSENEEDLNVWRAKRKGYHWDTSDWAPRPSLPNISEIPANEVTDSPASTPPSYDSNERVPMLASATTSAVDSMTHNISAVPDHDYMTDSEYVGETENELDFEDRDPMLPSYADLPRYDQLLAHREFNDSYELPPMLNVHPNTYLPYYDQESMGDPQAEDEGSSLSDEQNSEVDSGLVQAVAERVARRQHPGRAFLSPGYTTSGDYQTDQDPLSHASFIDNMSMSVGGYTSNASCSDISGLCEIEDSEINNSDDNEEEETEFTPCLASRLHTQV